jgi:predicted transcriptional regulator
MTNLTVHLSDEVSAMVERLANKRGQEREDIAVRLIEAAARQQIEFEDFIQEGIDAVERGDTLTQEEMEQWLDAKIAQRSRPIAAE